MRGTRQRESQPSWHRAPSQSWHLGVEEEQWLSRISQRDLKEWKRSSESWEPGSQRKGHYHDLKDHYSGKGEQQSGSLGSWSAKRVQRLDRGDRKAQSWILWLSQCVEHSYQASRRWNRGTLMMNMTTNVTIQIQIHKMSQQMKRVK